MKVLKNILALLLTAALAVGCIFLPGYVADRQEQRAYGALRETSLRSSFGTLDVPQETAVSVREETDAAEESAVPALTDVGVEMAEAAETEDFSVPLPLTETPVSFTVWQSVPDELVGRSETAQSNSVHQALQARTGVFLDLVFVSSQVAMEQFQLMAAADDLTDVIDGAVDYYSAGADMALADGVLLDLTELVPEYAPRYQQLITQEAAAYTPRGRIAGIYRLNTQEYWTHGGYVLWTEYLQRVGLDIPATYVELEEVLRAFQEEFGAKALLRTDPEQLNQLAAGFGASMGMQVRDGQVCFGPQQQEFRMCLETLGAWCGENLLVTDRGADPQTPVNRQQFGCFYVTEAEFADYGLAEGGFDTLTPLPPLTQAASEPVMACGVRTQVEDVCWSISANCQQPELLLQYLDLLFSEEGMRLCTFGVEGETFTYGDNSTAYFTDVILSQSSFAEAQIQYLAYHMPTFSPSGAGFRDQAVYQTMQIWNGMADGGPAMTYPVQPEELERYMEDSERQAYSGLMSDINLYVEEQVSRCLMDVDALAGIFAEMDAELEALGLSDCLEICQAAYSRSALGAQ